MQFLQASGLVTSTNTTPAPIISLRGADRLGADLHNATVTQEQLATCNSLRGAILPDGTTVPDDQDFPIGWK